MQIRFLGSQTTPKTGTGLQRIAELLQPLLDDTLPVEDTRDSPTHFFPDPAIHLGKEATLKNHKKWLPNLPSDTLLLYTNGS